MDPLSRAGWTAGPMAAVLKMFGLSLFGMVLYFLAFISELGDHIGGLMYSPDRHYTRETNSQSDRRRSSGADRRPAVTKSPKISD